MQELGVKRISRIRAESKFKYNKPMSIYTNGDYLQANPGWHGQDAHWKLGHLLYALEQAKIAKPLQTVCDVGCGSGELIKEWARRQPAMHFTGCDISPQAHTLCLKNAPPNTHFIHGAPAEESVFDAVLAIDVLEHLPDPDIFLKSLEKNTDLLILHVPLDLSFRTLVNPEILEQERSTVGHVHFYTAPYLKKWLHSRGYTILSWHYTNKYVERPPVLTSRRSRIGMAIRRLAHSFLPRAWAAWWVGGYSVMLVARCRRPGS